MNPIPSIDESAIAIKEEINLNLSYFYDDPEPHFDPMSIAVGVGMVLLMKFLDGVCEGLKDEAEEAAEEAGKGTGHLLGKKLRDLFSGSTSSKDIEREVNDSANQARTAIQGVESGIIIKTITITEERLIDYLIDDRGLPRRDAVKISRMVRIETQRQLGITGDKL
jgi:hypothetical protein